MAEGIVTDAMGRILEVLGSRAFQEIQLAYGVKGEIRKLKDTVETINGVLLDAEEQFNQKKKSSAVTCWLRRLKDAVYDADDLLDDFYTQLKLKEEENKVRIFFSQPNQIAYSLKMGHKIKTIRKRLDDIKNDKQFLLFKHDNGKEVNYYLRERAQTHSFVLEENVIGRDDDKKAILQLLLDSNDHAENNVSVISIVGIGGIGKTTLVQSIYNVEKVKTHFELRMWVCISDDFTLKIIVEKILKSANKKEIENLEMDQLQGLLRERIDGKKYLLVLDDVWNKNPTRWGELEDLLRNGVGGSKILVTTREKGVANIMSKPPLIYFLRGLTDDKSWSLFIRTAFKQGKEPKDSSLVEIGRDIVAKCVGVPLAIRTIGNLLCCKDKEEEWLSFRDNELSELDEQGDILPILKLSYDHLSSQVKQCFAYCALFPKDYEFEKQNLIQLWMAQGFLGTPKKNQCLEDVGNEYFMSLFSGSFLQDLREEEDIFGGLITCKMHDLMHDVAQSVAGNECKMVTSDTDDVDEKSRHISFDSNSKSLKISNAMLSANCLRTFFSLCSHAELNKSHFKKILSNFKCLRSLNLRNLGIEKVPTLIGKLKRLRYLNLSWNENIKELPNSVSRLINLQTLDLSYCENLKNLPRDMRKMMNLQYLMIYGCHSLIGMPCELGQLTILRILPYFVVHNEDIKKDGLRELKRLNKLRGFLTIAILGVNFKNVNLSEANLEEKQYLESIGLVGGGMMIEGLQPHPNLKNLSIFGLGSVTFSGCMSSFTNLTEIEISQSSTCVSITPLDQLPSLLLLTLCMLFNLEYMSVSDRASNSSNSTPATTTATFFPSLTQLRIVDCSKLKGWRKINDDEDGQVTTTEKAQLLSFPCLYKLYVGRCPMLTCMPFYPTLEELYLCETSAKPLQQTMKMRTSADAATPSTSYSAFSTPALSNLKYLTLEFVNDLESPPELLQRLTSLEYLSIGGFDQLDWIDDDDVYDKLSQWQGLKKLRYLNFDEIENMVHLPKWIHHITTLKSLKIERCRNFKSLPEAMQLEELDIWDCPYLSERCGNNKGVDWPKIAHIPNIMIDGVDIPWKGHYQDRSH